MAESVQVPRDAHEAWNAGVRFALQMVNPSLMVGSQWATWERHNPFPASSGVGSPEQPQCPCKAPEAKWVDCLHPWHGLHKGAPPVPVQPQRCHPKWEGTGMCANTAHVEPQTEEQSNG